MAVKIGSSGAASDLGATGGGAALRGRGDDEGNFGRWANIVVGSTKYYYVLACLSASLSHI